MTNGQPDDLEDWYSAEHGSDAPGALSVPPLPKLALAIGSIPLGLAALFLFHRRSLH